MTDDDILRPTTAYDLLDEREKEAVDDYVRYAINQQHLKRERIIHAINLPIPYEYIKRSQKRLYAPLVRAAVAEKIKEAADEQDISPDRVIQEHAVIAFSNIADYIEPVGFGDFRVKDLNDVPPEKLGAIKSIEAKPGMYGLHTKVILHDKHPSLKAMGEMMGIVAPDNPPALVDYVKPPTDHSKKTDVSPERAYAELLEQ